MDMHKKSKSPIGKRIVRRLTEFADVLESGGDISAKFTCRKIYLKLEPTPYDPKLVKKTRAILRASQGIFAMFLGVSVDTVQAWENGTNSPSDIACRFMDEIRQDPSYWRARFGKLISHKAEA